MIHVEKRHLDIIQRILRQADVPFYAFGSRVSGKHKPFSDLDLCFMGPIPETILVNIETEFEESDLPFNIDIVEFQRCSEEFQALIRSTMVPFPNPRHSREGGNPGK